MKSAVLGHHGKPSATTSCMDVAALIGVALRKQNPSDSAMAVFNQGISLYEPNLEHSVVTIASALTSQANGGTDTAKVIELLLTSYRAEYAKGNTGFKPIDNIIIVSDNESWIGASGGSYTRSGTPLQHRWADYLKDYNPKAKLLCININPEINVQVKDSFNAVNIGGFSDAIFPLIADFFNHDTQSDFWVERIKTTVAL